MDVWVRKKEMEENTRGVIPLNLSYVQKKRVNQNHKKIEVNLKKTNMLFQKSKKLVGTIYRFTEVTVSMLKNIHRENTP